MQVVIDIPEELYQDIKEHGLCGHCSDREIVSEAIRNGVVLPKGHGDLVDMNTVTSTYNLQGELTSYDAVVVLEADKEA